MLSCGVSLLYSAFVSPKKLKERLALPYVQAIVGEGGLLARGLTTALTMSL